MTRHVSENAISVLLSLGEEAGFGWRRHSIKTRSTDELLNICIGDGIIPTKIDGWIHACTLTAKSLAKYARDKDRGLDIEQLTSWSGGNAAQRYARWQVDFHWKIDTRPWQFFLYMYTMKAAFADAFDASDKLSDDEKKALHEVNRQFWEEVVVIYSYRSEVIERSRGYAPHPDPTCGSSWQGYPYLKVWERDEVSFDELSMPFIEKGKSDYERVEGKVEPRPFPAVNGQIGGEIPSAAKIWIRQARDIDICDEWLRVPLGERMVPTRFNGWWASIEQVLKPLTLYAEGGHADNDGVAASLAAFDLRDYAVRFALTQAEFQRRLNGEPGQLIALLGSATQAFEELLAARGADAAKVRPFVDIASKTIAQVADAGLTIAEEELPELVGARPIHPRYAPVDPLEPLHWQVANPERYLTKMRKLGYTL